MVEVRQSRANSHPVPLGADADAARDGEAAADQPAVAGQQPHIVQRVEEDKLGAVAAQGIEIVGVVETKGVVARHGDSEIGGSRGAKRRRRRQRRRAGGDGEPRVEIDAARDRLRHAVHDCIGACRLARRDQAEAALAQRQALVTPNGAEHRQLSVALDGGAQLGDLPLGTDAVDDDAGDLQPRRDAARHAEGVDSQHDWRAREPRQRGEGIAAGDVDAVVQALASLNQRDVAAGAARERGEELAFALGVENQECGRAVRWRARATSDRCGPARS